jgi:osmoprotectant transport system substrate-binding protein
VYPALEAAVPEGLAVLEAAPATDQDTYTVTGEFASQYGVASIPDLANVDVPLTIGANAEFEERPYSPAQAEAVYGVTLGFQATGDTTLDALLAGTIQVADIYTTDPAIEANGLVVLEDPEGLILVQNVVPLVSADLSEDFAAILDPISEALTTDELIVLNTRSTADQESSDTIATDWLTENGFI